ncbi:hypothetical protein TELCIR_01569 [Teladorsagia circumcincta]|uniref:Uncharacterized protein n=1 Tax=Teladorsagia circumcincta TaxID=45464 RepID=A0A2G9V1L7_TELCI|nr:hypothetical protein TELCIR_01569 [Teladorsagia circumcincta]
MMRAYEFLTNTPVKLDEHRGYLVDDVALVRSSPPLSPPIKGGYVFPADKVILSAAVSPLWSRALLALLRRVFEPNGCLCDVKRRYEIGRKFFRDVGRLGRGWTLAKPADGAGLCRMAISIIHIDLESRGKK